MVLSVIWVCDELRPATPRPASPRAPLTGVVKTLHVRDLVERNGDPPTAASCGCG